MLLFPLFNYGIPLWYGDLLLGIVAITLAYFLGIYLIRGIAVAAAEGRSVFMIVTGALVALLSVVFTHPQQLLMMEVNWAAMVISGLVIGRRALVERSQLALYFWGLSVVVIGGLITWAPHWSTIMQAFSDNIGEVAVSLKETLIGLGYGEAVAEESVTSIRHMMETVTKLVPTGTVMNIVAQFSVAFLWFLYRGVPGHAAVGELKQFTLWKAPFALTPFLIVAILAYLFGGETLNLAAVNVLAALSIFYCVTGLSLMEHLLSRLKVPLWFKVMFYIVLTLSGLIGYFGAALLGFIDSFADWRKTSGGAMNLNNSD